MLVKSIMGVSEACRYQFSLHEVELELTSSLKSGFLRVLHLQSTV